MAGLERMTTGSVLKRLTPSRHTNIITTYPTKQFINRK